MGKWIAVRDISDIPEPGRYMVTRTMDEANLRLAMFAEVLVYRGRRYWVKDGHGNKGKDAYPYTDVVAYQPDPGPFTEE